MWWQAPKKPAAKPKAKRARKVSSSEESSDSDDESTSEVLLGTPHIARRLPVLGAGVARRVRARDSSPR